MCMWWEVGRGGGGGKRGVGRFFPFRADPFLEGIKTILTVVSLEMYQFPLNLLSDT